jgi:hypothetical protein
MHPLKARNPKLTPFNHRPGPGSDEESTPGALSRPILSKFDIGTRQQHHDASPGPAVAEGAPVQRRLYADADNEEPLRLQRTRTPSSGAAAAVAPPSSAAPAPAAAAVLPSKTSGLQAGSPTITDQQVRQAEPLPACLLSCQQIEERTSPV